MTHFGIKYTVNNGWNVSDFNISYNTAKYKAQGENGGCEKEASWNLFAVEFYYS